MKLLESVLLDLWLGSMHIKILLSRLVTTLFGYLYSVTDSAVLVDLHICCKS